MEAGQHPEELRGRASAVVYVGQLARMRAFYQGCFGLTPTDVGEDHCTLASAAWLLTLVRSRDAPDVATPVLRRTSTPIKLAFRVPSLAALRPVVNGLGGQLDPAETSWTYLSTTRCDGVDPEGNVIQLYASAA